jgi:hypothetical protein
MGRQIRTITFRGAAIGTLAIAFLAPPPAHAASTWQGMWNSSHNWAPATLTLTSTDPIQGTIDVQGYCTADWTEVQRYSDSQRLVNAHVTSPDSPCVDNQWKITYTGNAINGTDSLGRDGGFQLTQEATPQPQPAPVSAPEPVNPPQPASQPAASSKVEAAITKALSMVGRNDFGDVGCVKFVTAAYNAPATGYLTAKEWRNGLNAQGKIHMDTNPPRGALVFSESAADSGAGHVDIALGDGTFVSGGVWTGWTEEKGSLGGGGSNQQVLSSWNIGDNTYLGWADPPW